jgi:hypothetical protein
MREVARSIKREFGGGRWPPPNTFRVPDVPPGWTIGPPDFVGIGAQKASTTWWYQLLASHPRVFEPQSRRKEIHYFDRFWDAPFTAADAQGYHAYFPRPAGGLAGEWTPRYMVDFWTPELLHQSAPDAKILVVLRDPFARFCSGVTHDLQHRAPHHQILTELAARRSTYREQLRRVLEYFDRDSILVLQYERCIADPRAEFKRTLEFVGLEDFEPPAALLRDGANVTRGSRYRPEARVRDAFIDTISVDLALLLRDFPEIDPSLWPSCAGLSASPQDSGL